MIPLKNPDKKTTETIFSKSFDPISKKVDELYIKCSCVSLKIKEEIMSSNLSDETKQIFSSIRTCHSSIKIEDFIKILYKETLQTYFPTRPIIWKVREKVSEKIGTTDEEFNKYLFDCVREGWIDLIEGSPFGGKETDWYDIGGRRFYYFEFKPNHEFKLNFNSQYGMQGKRNPFKFETDLILEFGWETR